MFTPPEIKARVCPVFCLSVFVDVSSPGSKHSNSLHLRLKCSRGNFPVDYVAILRRNANFITSTIKPPGEKDSRRLLRVTSRCFRTGLRLNGSEPPPRSAAQIGADTRTPGGSRLFHRPSQKGREQEQETSPHRSSWSRQLKQEPSSDGGSNSDWMKRSDVTAFNCVDIMHTDTSWFN